MKVSKLSALVRPLRFFAVAFICVIMFVVQVPSAIAASATPKTTQSAPTEGPQHLDEIQRKSEDTLRGIPDMEEVQRKSNEGLNEVQGDADIENMHRPSNSQDATSIQDEIEGVLKKATGQK